MVYKLVEINGEATIKFSEEIEKTTLPGSKDVVRVYTDNSERPSFDLICLHEEVS